MPRQVGPEPDPGCGPTTEEGASRVTPVLPLPDWLRERDERENPAVGDPTSDEGESRFWNAPPRYSVTSLSLLPAAAIPAPPRVRVWGARLLFSAVLCVVVTLLGLETTSWLHGAAATHALLGLQR